MILLKNSHRYIILPVLLINFLFSGCYTSPKSSMTGEFAFKSNAADFIKSISKNSIVFGTGVKVTTGGDSFFTGIGKAGRSTSLYPGFPLKISATIITEEIIKNAGEYYAKLLDLNETETDSFMNAYREMYDVENNNLIWIYMKTNFAESYLSPDRWVIFVEDEDQNQYEPLKISQSQPLIPDLDNERRDIWRRTRVKETHFALKFPKKKFDGHDWIPLSGKLKLVFMNPDKNIERADGTWIFEQE